MVSPNRVRIPARCIKVRTLPTHREYGMALQKRVWQVWVFRVAGTRVR